MKGIEITDLHFLGENDRGSTFEFENNRTGTQVLGWRHAGSISGKHYHEGKSSTKDPEIFILLKGQMEVFARNLNTGEEETFLINAPKSLEIHAFVYHEVKAITDIVFIELNSISEHAADTIQGSSL